MNKLSELLKPFGGEIKPDPENNGVWVGIYHGRFSRELFDIIKNISDLKSLMFYATAITDDDLIEVSKLHQLRKIAFLSCPSVTDEGLIHLSTLKQLTHLQLHDTSVTNQGIKLLKMHKPNLQIKV